MKRVRIPKRLARKKNILLNEGVPMLGWPLVADHYVKAL
jgi:hypothetical protein